MVSLVKSYPSYTERNEARKRREQSKGGMVAYRSVVSFDCGARYPRPSAQDD